MKLVRSPRHFSQLSARTPIRVRPCLPGKVASRADSWARPQSLRRLRKTCWIAHAAAVDDADAGEGDDEADEGEGEGEGEGEEGEDEGEQGEGEEDGRWDLGRELSYADNLNIEFGVPTMIEFLEEEEGQPRLWLKHPYSSMALEVYLHGAAITQWLRPDGTDNLFAPPSETFSPSTAMNSGVQLCFPQYREGHMVEDGFASRMPWEVVAAGFDFLEMSDGLGLDPTATPEETFILLKDELMKEYVKEEQEGEEGEEGEEAEEGEEGEAGEEEDDSEAGEAELLDFRELEGLDIPELKMPEGAGDLSPWDWDTMFGQALEDDKYGRNDDESSGDDEQENEEVEEMAKAPVVKSAKKAKASKKLKKVEVEEAGEEEAQTAGEEEEEEVVSSSKAGGGVEASGEGEEEEETSAGEGGWEGEGEQSLGEEEEGEEEIDVDKEWGAGEELNLDEATLDFKMRMDAGLDPAPFVTLRLTDNEDTLAVWPHKFELLYKITIMEDDDFPSILPKADGPSVDLSEQLFDDGPDGLPGGSVRRSDKKVRPGSGDPEKRIYRDLGLAKDAEDQFPDDGGIVAEEDPESLDPFHESLIDDVPTQLRLNFVLRNLDEEGSQPMQVQVAALASIATLDQTRHGDFIKVLGLGGGNTLDYTEDSRAPRLDASEDDYLYFGGDRVDKTYVGAAQADVKMCPGNRTHYDLLPRFGFQDVIAYHPGLTHEGTPEMTADTSRFWAKLGVGNVSSPLTLQPGEMWTGEYVIRQHNKYWEEPIFGELGMPPMPALVDKGKDTDDTFDSIMRDGDVIDESAD